MSVCRGQIMSVQCQMMTANVSPSVIIWAGLIEQFYHVTF